MQKLTRRRLIRQASIGAGAVSILAATASTKTYASKARATSHTSALASDEALVVYVTDAKAGTLTVLRGEQATTINNAALVQQLLSL